MNEDERELFSLFRKKKSDVMDVNLLAFSRASRRHDFRINSTYGGYKPGRFIRTNDEYVFAEQDTYDDDNLQLVVFPNAQNCILFGTEKV